MSAPLKDHINKDSIHHLANIITQAHPEFSTADFVKTASNDIDSLELKQRISHIISALDEHLGDDFEKNCEILIATKNYWQQLDNNQQPSSFLAWALIDYIGDHGINHPELAIPTLESLTELFSAEFAMRAYIERHPEQTWPQLLIWTQSENEHVRRLASECCRPRLPWGKQLRQLIKDPSPIWPIIEALLDDDSLYVRKSVANNLNDISKDHPDVLLDKAAEFIQVESNHRQWIIKHACRTLIKQGHPNSFALLGYDSKFNVSASLNLAGRTHCKVGDDISFEVMISNNEQQARNIVVDFAVIYTKAKGKISRKVFKLKNLALESEQSITINKKVSFKPISTRRYYSGEHAIELLINGQSMASQSFILAL